MIFTMKESGNFHGDVLVYRRVPPGNNAFFIDSYGIMVVNIPLIMPYLYGGRWHWGGARRFPWWWAVSNRFESNRKLPFFAQCFARNQQQGKGAWVPTSNKKIFGYPLHGSCECPLFWGEKTIQEEGPFTPMKTEVIKGLQEHGPTI